MAHPDMAGVSMSMGSEPAFALRCTVCEENINHNGRSQKHERVFFEGFWGIKEREAADIVYQCNT